MGDREIAESFSLQNEVAVNRLYAASDHERELNAAKIERSEAQQHLIEWQLGTPGWPPVRGPWDRPRRRWSGAGF
jgi:hypothetical protein